MAFWLILFLSIEYNTFEIVVMGFDWEFLHTESNLFSENPMFKLNLNSTTFINERCFFLDRKEIGFGVARTDFHYVVISNLLQLKRRKIL